MGRLRRLCASAILCVALFMPVLLHAQDEMGATPDASDNAAPTDPAKPDTAKPDTAKPDTAKPAKPAKELPPSVEDVPLPPPPPPGTMVDMPIAELQALDKVTARTTHIEAKVGDTASFGSLSIAVKACRSAAPEDPPESAAFLVITEQSPGDEPTLLYSGWMFASSPALAAMDNPIYDIWLTECRQEALPAATK